MVGRGGYFEWTHGFARFLCATPSLAYQAMAAACRASKPDQRWRSAGGVGTVLALGGHRAGGVSVSGRSGQVGARAAADGSLYWLSYGKLFFDPIYNGLFVWPLRLLAGLSYWLDRFVIDGLVNFIGRIPPTLAEGLRSLQTGMVQFYALAMLWGVLVLMATLLIWPAGRVELEMRSGEMDLGIRCRSIVTGDHFHAAGRRAADRAGRRPGPEGRPAKRAGDLAVYARHDAPSCWRTTTPGDEPYAASSFAWLGPSSGIDIQFAVGLDGLSLWLFGLSSLLLVTCVLVSWEAIVERPSTFYALLLMLGTGMLGVFAARDIILFYVFFEFTLIPLFFLIGVWGSEDRRYAAAKFFLYTLAGSLLTFLGLLAIVLWDYNHSARA